MKVDVERVFCGLLGNSGEIDTISNKGNISSSAVYYNHFADVDKMEQLKNNHRSNYHQQQDDCNIPRAIKTVNEASFAANKAQSRLVAMTKATSTNSNTEIPYATGTNSYSAATAKNIPLLGKVMVSTGQRETWNIQPYLTVFRELLQIEYAETQRLYEASYTHYSIKITNPVGASTKGGKIYTGIAQFKMMGIADGRPSIKVGDRVLIRPHKGVYTFSNPHSAKKNYNHKNNPSMVEIVAYVLALHRGGGETGRKGKKKDTVLISWVEDSFLDNQLKRQMCTVRFIPSSTTHERSLTALHWLRTIDPGVARDLLFPSKPPRLPPPPAIEESSTNADITEEREYEQLNANQARFVELVIARTVYPTKERVRPPMVLTGPAGTGKTKTLLAAILQVIRRDRMQQLKREIQQEQWNSDNFKPRRSRILICTPSHTACDVITERLANLLSENFNDMKEDTNEVQKMLFRLNDATRTIESVPVQILPYTRQKGSDGHFVLPETSELLDFSVIVCTCQDAHLLFLAGLTNSCLRRRREILKMDIERSLMKAGLELKGTILGCKDPHFTHLFIDEAAQATEPECLIPISVVVDDDPDTFKAEIALCGDPRQLGPRMYSPDALESLQQSLLERLLRLPVDAYGGGRNHLMGPPTAGSRLALDEIIEYSFQKSDHRQHLSVFLNLSYRGHPSFLLMPSKLFYFDKLRSYSKNSLDDTWIKAVREIESLSENAFPENLTFKQMDWPIVFRGVKGKCTSMAIESFFGSNCWCNHAESNAVVEMIEKVIKSGISTASIGVMAAFRAQVVLIRRALRARNLGNVNVGMIEDYQSMERHIIILSLTRTSKALMCADVTSGEGLFHQHKRMNVALTRAERILVVVGEPNLMRYDKAWVQWLSFCRDNGLWYGEKGEEKEP